MARMLASDLDGTLLAPDGSVSPRTMAALRAAHSSDLTVTLVTGRPPRWLAPIVDLTGWHGFAVSANGAVLVDLTNGIIEQTFPIDQLALAETVARVAELMPGSVFAIEHVVPGAAVAPLATGSNRSFAHEPGYAARLPIPTGTPAMTAAAMTERPDVVKLLARGPAGTTHNPDDTVALLQLALDGVVTVTHSNSRDVLLEISGAGISKGSGVAWLARTHGIAQCDVVAVGDMPNDLPMLTWAGEAWAMENGHPGVRELVGRDRVLASNADDGVAQLIEKLLAATQT